MPIDKMPMDKMLIDRNALLIIDQKSSQVGSQKCLRVVAPANISAREASIYLPDLIAAIILTRISTGYLLNTSRQAIVPIE